MKKAFLVVAAAVIVPVGLALLLPYWLVAVILVVAAIVGYIYLATLEDDMLPEQEHEDYNDDIGTGY